MKFNITIFSILLWSILCFGENVEVTSGDFSSEVSPGASVPFVTDHEVLLGSGEYAHEVQLDTSLSRHAEDFPFFYACLPSPCMNGGVCLITSCNSSGCYDYRCNCTEDYEGELCLQPVAHRQLSLLGNDSSSDIVSSGSVCTADKCVGYGCRCVESCRHEYGYYCVNSFGFVGHNCTLQPPVLQCLESEITLDIPLDFLRQFTSALQGWTVFASQTYDGAESSNPLCQGQLARNELGQRVLTFVIPLPFSTCGYTVRQGNRVFYNNTIWIDITSSVLYRFPRPVLDFSCSYEMNYIVTTSLLPVFDVPAVLKGSLKGDVSLELCKVSTCDRDCPSNLVVKTGAVYTVAQTIHLNVQVATRSTIQSFLTEVTEAYLSCSSSPDFSGQEVILQRGCIVDSWLDVKLARRGSLTGSCMSFRVPQMSSCRRVYLHVTMRICYPQFFNSSVCSNGVEPGHCTRRQKRSISDPTVIHHRVGPLIIVDGQKGFDEISLQSDNGDVVIIGNLPPTTTQRLHTEQLHKVLFDSRHLIIGFVAFAGALLIICITLLAYSYSKRREDLDEDSVLV